MFPRRRTLKIGGLHVFALLFGIGCGAEEAEELVSGTELDVSEEAGDGEAEGAEEENAPSGSADEELGGATPDRVPIAGEGKERGRILGTIEVPGYKKGTIQLDAVVELEDGAKVIANERYRRPGPFRLVVRGDYEEVNLIAYLDLDDDGPTAGDLRYEYEGNPITLADGERIEGLVVTVLDEPTEVLEEPPPDGGAGETPAEGGSGERAEAGGVPEEGTNTPGD